MTDGIFYSAARNFFVRDSIGFLCCFIKNPYMGHVNHDSEISPTVSLCESNFKAHSSTCTSGKCSYMSHSNGNAPEKDDLGHRVTISEGPQIGTDFLILSLRREGFRWRIEIEIRLIYVNLHIFSFFLTSEPMCSSDL